MQHYLVRLQIPLAVELLMQHELQQARRSMKWQSHEKMRVPGVLKAGVLFLLLLLLRQPAVAPGLVCVASQLTYELPQRCYMILPLTLVLAEGNLPPMLDLQKAIPAVKQCASGPNGKCTLSKAECLNLCRVFIDMGLPCLANTQDSRVYMRKIEKFAFDKAG